MPLSPEQEALCERVEKGEPDPGAAALIRQQAQEIDALWDRLSHAYALVRRESPAEMIQEEMEALRAMLDERRRRVRPEWPYAAAREQILSDEGGGCSVASEVAGEAPPSQRASPGSQAGPSGQGTQADLRRTGPVACTRFG